MDITDIENIEWNIHLGFKIIEKHIINNLDHNYIKNTDFWYLILNNTETYLNYYKKTKNIKVLPYITWFIENWPPKLNKNKKLLLPKKNPPPEVLLSELI
tara:strand:- start:2138 stop:2437 length:300 start_codon:yes stop_codon:yes gene_type:complete